jgi:Nickel-dependent hydrogenase
MATRQRRAAAVAFERFAELLRGLVLGRFAGDHDTLRVAQNLLRALAPLQAEFARGRARSETLSQIKMGLEALGIGSAAEPVLPGTPLAATMASARRAADDGGWRHMPAEQCFLSVADDRAIVTRLIDAGAAFAQAPELDGRFPETGVWARGAIRHTVSQADPAARLSARIAEIAALLRWIEAGETENDVAEAVASYALGPRRGAAAVECARGRLHHVIELDQQGRVAGFEFLAPTEWNFHPRGPVVKSLIGAALRGATDHDAVDAMVGSFDPCVGYHLAFQEMADA